MVPRTSAPEEGPLPRIHHLMISMPRQQTSMQLKSTAVTLTVMMKRATQWCRLARMLGFRASLAPTSTYCSKAKAIREWLLQSFRFVVMHRWLQFRHLERMTLWYLPLKSIWQKAVGASEQRASSMRLINQKSGAWWRQLKIWLSKKKVHLSSQSHHSLRTPPHENLWWYQATVLQSSIRRLLLNRMKPKIWGPLSNCLYHLRKAHCLQSLHFWPTSLKLSYRW